MLEPTALLAFSLTALLFAASPGPNFVFVLTRAVGFGRGEGFASVLGICTGSLVHTLAAVLGLSALLASSALAFSTVKYAGAAYLIFLGVKTLLQREQVSVVVASLGRAGGARAFRQGLVTMLLNPKAALYYFAFLPQFVDPSLGTAQSQLLVLGLIQAAAAFTIYTGVSLSAGMVGGLLRRNLAARRVQKWVTGCTYLVLGASVAVSGRK